MICSFVNSSCMHSTTSCVYKFLPQRRSSFHDTPQSLVGSESNGERQVRVFDFNIKLSRHRAEELLWDRGCSQMSWTTFFELQKSVQVLIEFASYPLHHMAGSTSVCELSHRSSWSCFHATHSLSFCFWIVQSLSHSQQALPAKFVLQRRHP